MNSKILRTICLVGLFFVTQLTRFENTVIISSNGTELSVITDRTHLNFTSPDISVQGVSVSLQHSMVSESVLRSLLIEDEVGQPVVKKSALLIHLFGSTFGRALAHG